jgi:DNA-binding ferritin-like protein
MTLSQALLDVFNTNFVAYYRSHTAHINIVGRNFTSDHKLLGKVYETLQADIDTIGEFVRTVNEFVPESLEIVGDASKIAYDQDVFGPADDLLETVLTDLGTLVGLYRTLDEQATDEDQKQISNFAQDRITALDKYMWMLRSTLEE